MDLLGSILNSMDKPPAMDEKQKQLIKKQKEEVEKQRLKQKEELNKFRKYVTERIQRFAGDERRYVEFQPLDQIYRQIIHEVAEHAGLIAMSFGQDDVDRYTVVYKREFAPMEDEIRARRSGKEWNEKIAEEYAVKREEEERERENKKRKAVAVDDYQRSHPNPPKADHPKPTKSDHPKPTKSSTTAAPPSHYKDKYAHIIGRYSDANAVGDSSDKTYGCVPSRNKKDVRSIEQAMADIRAQKRMKLSNTQQSH